MPCAAACESAFCCAAVLTCVGGTETDVGPLGDPMGSGDWMVAAAVTPASGFPVIEGARV